MLYLVSAAALGAMLLRGVIQVHARPSGIAKPAWSVYKFSLLYLALLFAAMVVDRVSPADGEWARAGRDGRPASSRCTS